MKKATSSEYLDLLKNFKLDHNITDSNFDYYAAIKFNNSTSLKEFNTLTLVKTNNYKYPILIKNYSKNLVKQNNESKFQSIKGDELLEINTYTQIIKDSDKTNLKLLSSCLNESHSFKDFVKNVNLKFNCNNELYDFFPIYLNNLSSIKIVDNFNYLNDILKDKVNEATLNHILSDILESIEDELFLEPDISKYDMLSSYRAFYPENVSFDGDVSYSGLIDIYYNKLDSIFDIYKIKHSLKLGLLLNTRTEEEILNTPELNSFIDIIKEKQPTWFRDFSNEIDPFITDDNEIKASGITLEDQTLDFDLFNIGFIGSVMPSYINGYYNLSKHYIDNKENSIHICGDNVFFKEYYYNLKMEYRDNLKICIEIQSDISFDIELEDRKKYLKPLFDYLDKNNIILDVLDDSSILKYIEKDELLLLLKNNYPNLIVTLGLKDISKSIEIVESKSFDDALNLYKSFDSNAIDPKVKNKYKL